MSKKLVGPITPSQFLLVLMSKTVLAFELLTLMTFTDYICSEAAEFGKVGQKCHIVMKGFK